MPVIAIVDDNESFRHATVSFIRSLGYAVLQFASAEAFLKSNRLYDTDCLISDVQMPGMNGIELQGELITQGHRFPIIFGSRVAPLRGRHRLVRKSTRPRVRLERYVRQCVGVPRIADLAEMICQQSAGPGARYVSAVDCDCR